MDRSALHVAIFAALLAIARPAWAKPEVTVEVNRGAQATAKFQFDKIPAPSDSDAAIAAKLKIVAGRRDANGGQLSVLNDGKLPEGDDSPRDNFFLTAGSEGGRLLVDLGDETAIKRVNTYSWHAGSRGPQVYKLYGGNSRAKSFDLRTASDAILGNDDWELLASVDTRPAEGEFGGQHGVSIAGDDGGALGKYRYLLFEAARTENMSPFGLTFFSEIDVDDGRKHEPPARVAPDVVRIGDKYEISFDASDAPDLKPWIDETLKPICIEWYPKIVEMLPSEGYEAPKQFTIYFHADMEGVAHAMGTEIHCAEPWFSRNLDGEAAGAVVHEMVHIVQQYGRTRGAQRNPGWMVEGLADYIRWFLYEPVEKRRQPDPDRAKYTDSYQTTAAFLEYLVSEHDAKIIEKFNAAMRHGDYDEALWEEFTDKSVDQLWADYVRQLTK